MWLIPESIRANHDELAQRIGESWRCAMPAANSADRTDRLEVGAIGSIGTIGTGLSNSAQASGEIGLSLVSFSPSIRLEWRGLAIDLG